MKVVVMLIIAVPSLSLQEHRRRQCDSCSSSLDHSGQSQEYDYDHNPIYYRAATRKHKHKKHSNGGGKSSRASAELDSANNKYIDRHSNRRSHRHSNPRYDRAPGRNSDMYSDCVCDCQKCDDLQQCCQPVCNNECSYQTEQTNQVDAVQPGLSPGNVVFVPYPYPLVVPPPPPPVIPGPPAAIVPMLPDNMAPSTMSTLPSIEHTTKFSGNMQKQNLLDLLHNLRRRQEPSYRDLVAMRPLKQNHITEYGEISDHLLDQLLSNVRNVKDIQSG